MHASIRRAKGHPGSMAEIARILKDGYTDKLAEITGFRGYYVVDLGDDELITISLYDDEAGTRESAALAREIVSGRMREHMASALDVRAGKVVVEKTA